MAFKLFDRVQESSTTTGTGDFTVSGAITGYVTFSSRYSTGDTLYYCIHAVDTNGVPTGEWEVGLGTYSAANTLTRTTVLSSSNSDALVSFSSGGKRVFVTMTALQGGSIREKLTADRTYYVRTDGSDSNDGLANTSGGAFLTLQKAIDVFCKTIDCAGYAANVQVGDGTYTVGGAMGQLVGQTKLTITGNVSTPANVIISTTSANAFQNYIGGMTLEVKSLKVQTTTSGSGLVADSGGTMTLENIVFGACASYHRLAQRGGRIAANGNYSITGGASAHLVSSNYGVQQTYSRTVTITGTPNFSVAYAYMNTTATIEDVGNTFSGSATGKRYSNSANSVINVGGASTTYLPGNVAGDTPTTGAQYI